MRPGSSGPDSRDATRPDARRGRRARRRRRHHRHLPAVPRARGRVLGAAARSGRRRRRYVVLEPLPGRAVRLRELHVRLPVLARALRRVGVAGTLRRAARDRALPQPRRRPLRPAPAHALRRAGHLRRVRRVGGRLDGDRRRRLGVPGALRCRRNRRPVGAVRPRRPGARRLPRRTAAHGPVAGRTRRPRGQTRRRDRNGIERRAAGARDRRRGRVAHRVPTHRQLVHAAQQPADHGRRAGAAARRLRSHPRDLEHVGARVPPRSARPRRIRRFRRGTARVLRADVGEPGLLQAHEQLRRSPVRRGRQRHVVRVPRREDPQHRARSRDRGEADPQGPPLRRAPPAVRHGLLRDVQRAERVARRHQADADRARRPGAGSRRPTASVRST